MGSQALAGKQAVLEVGDTTPPAQPTVWTPLVEVYEIGDFVINRASYDVTSHGPSIYRNVIPGLADVIEQNISLNYVEAQYQTLFDNMEAGDLLWFRTYWPDSKYHQYEAYVGNVSSMTPLDDRIMYTVTLRVTQDPAFV